MPKVKDSFDKYVRLLKENNVGLEELIFTKRLSKNSNNYQQRNTVENNALKKLNREGKSLRAGEVLQYIITDYYQTRSKNNRAIPVEIIDKRTAYDVKRYTELLLFFNKDTISHLAVILNAIELSFILKMGSFSFRSLKAYLINFTKYVDHLLSMSCCITNV